MRRDKQDPPRKDPVCGMVLSFKTAAVVADHEGKTYYFCAEACREQFKADPEKYTRRRQRS